MRCLITIDIFNRNIINSEMASRDLLSNEYSDHSILKLDTKILKVNNLNVAQLGRFQLFPNNEVPEGFSWESTLKTATMLIRLAEKKLELTELGHVLLTIAFSSDCSISEKNIIIGNASHLLLKELNQLGFPVKSFKMTTNKLFNPGVSRNLLSQNPDKYIQGPSFVLEDTESFTGRMKAGFNAMFEDSPDIITAQEMEFGQSDGIDFSNIHSELLGLYSNYSFVTPAMESNATVAATYFRKDIFDNTSQRNPTLLTELKTRMKCFGDSDMKTTIVSLEHQITNKEFIVINIHADYSRANNEKPWKILRDLFNEIPNLIVAGDFNLTLKNESYFRDAFENFNGKYVILQTPEPVEIGRPTYDLILVN